MITEEDFGAAAEAKPEMAFVRLERKFRQVLEQNLENSQSGNAYESYMLEYMNHAIGAAIALNLDFLSDWELPTKDVSKSYREFTTIVDRFAVQVQIEHIRQPVKYSVALEDSEKRIVRHYVEQIKEVIDKSKLSVAKKERLYDKVNDFLAELDRDRTKFEVFSDLVIGFAHVGGEAAEELEPAWKWVQLIGKLFGARQENEQVRLPKPKSPKQIEGPKKQPPQAKPSRPTDMDDEIPF